MKVRYVLGVPGRRRDGAEEQVVGYEIAPVYQELRAKAFGYLDDAIPPELPSGVIMETGYAEGVATLAALSDGTVSLYFSNGSGTVGAGQHAGPAMAARQLGVIAARYAPNMPILLQATLPKLDETKLYVLTGGVVRGVAGRQEDFGNNRMPQSPLFHAAHNVITAMRQIDPASKPG